MDEVELAAFDKGLEEIVLTLYLGPIDQKLGVKTFLPKESWDHPDALEWQLNDMWEMAKRALREKGYLDAG